VSLGYLAELGALERLEGAATALVDVGHCRNMYLHPYDGSISATGALLRAFGVGDKEITAWDGDILSLGLLDLHVALLMELINCLEAMVDDDLETWNDGVDIHDVLRLFRKLAVLIEFGPMRSN
jgi:hypothetical protein